MQLKFFVLPIKNLGAAEAEMNAFLRGHQRLLLTAKSSKIFEIRKFAWSQHLDKRTGVPSCSSSLRSLLFAVE